MSIESFVNNPLGKCLVGLLRLINSITVIGGKSPLDTPKGTVVVGLVVLGLTLLAVRIAAIVS